MPQLDTSIRCGKTPINGPSLGIAHLLPGRCFPGQGYLVRDTPVQALAGQDAQFNLRHIEPTPMLGGVVDLQPFGQAPGRCWGEHLIKGCWGVGIEVVQTNTSRSASG